MATLTSLVTAIQNILQDSVYTGPYLIEQVNDAVLNIAAGIRMPNGEISPPLPDLYARTTVNTDTTLPYVPLPVDYQRNVFNVFDDTNYQILPPNGGDYYAFSRFIKQISQLNLSESGEIYRVCVKGRNLYYQGIPTTSTTLGVHYYRKPVPMALDGDEPEGIPEHLAGSIIKHYVCFNLYGEKIEAGVSEPAIGMKYHQEKFYADMTDLIDFVGRESEPMYYGTGRFEDRGSCDG